MIKITHHVDFDFKDREATDLEKLNRILAALKLEKLELKNSKGYLAVAQDGQGNLLEKRYGLDSGTLICTPSRSGDCYQIDTAVADRSVDYDEFLENHFVCDDDYLKALKGREECLENLGTSL